MVGLEVRPVTDQLVDVALQRAAVEQRAGDVVEPQALAQGMQCRGGGVVASSAVSESCVALVRGLAAANDPVGDRGVNVGTWDGFCASGRPGAARRSGRRRGLPSRAPCRRRHWLTWSAAASNSAPAAAERKLRLLQDAGAHPLGQRARRASPARAAVRAARVPGQRRSCWPRRVHCSNALRGVPTCARTARRWPTAASPAPTSATDSLPGRRNGSPRTGPASCGWTAAMPRPRPASPPHLPTLLTRAEATALAELKLPGYDAIDRLRGADTSDARLPAAAHRRDAGDGFTREAFSDAVDASYLLRPGPGTPSRSTAHFAAAPVVWRRQTPPRARPELRAELARPPRAVHRLPLHDAQALMDLARAAMVTRGTLARGLFLRRCRRRLVGGRRRWPGLCVLRRAAGAAACAGGDLRRPDAAQRRADRLPAVGPRGPQRGTVLQHLRQLSRHRGRIHLCALAGGAAPGVRQHLVQHRALPAGLAQRRGPGLRRVVVLRQARLRAARRRGRAAGSRRGRTAAPRSAASQCAADTLRRLAARHLFFDLDPTQALPYIDLAGLGLRSGATLSARTAADRESGVEQASAELVRHAALASWRGFIAGAARSLAAPGAAARAARPGPLERGRAPCAGGPGARQGRPQRARLR